MVQFLFQVYSGPIPWCSFCFKFFVVDPYHGAVFVSSL